MPSPWIPLQDACALAENVGVDKRKVVNGLKDGELLARASDLHEYQLSRAECDLLRFDTPSILVFVGDRVLKISVSEHIAPLDAGEHQKEIGGDLYTIVRHDNRADIWYESRKVLLASRVDLDPYFWHLAHPNIANSWAIADDLHSYIRRKASGILLNRSDLARLSPHLKVGSGGGKKGAAGRPPAVNWEHVAWEIVRISQQDHASITSQADLVKCVRDFLSTSHEAGGEDLAESTLKEHIGPLHKLLWPKI